MATEAASAQAGKGIKLPTPLSLESFELGVTLGTGSFGRVRFATHKVSCSIPVFKRDKNY